MLREPFLLLAIVLLYPIIISSCCCQSGNSPLEVQRLEGSKSCFKQQGCEETKLSKILCSAVPCGSGFFIRITNCVNMSAHTDLIESGADFVDEVILHVGKRKAANKSLIDSCFGREFALLLVRPEFQRQLPPLVTAEDRVEFVGKYFTCLCIPQEVLKSKLQI